MKQDQLSIFRIFPKRQIVKKQPDRDRAPRKSVKGKKSRTSWNITNKTANSRRWLKRDTKNKKENLRKGYIRESINVNNGCHVDIMMPHHTARIRNNNNIKRIPGISIDSTWSEKVLSKTQMLICQTSKLHLDTRHLQYKLPIRIFLHTFHSRIQSIFLYCSLSVSVLGPPGLFIINVCQVNLPLSPKYNIGKQSSTMEHYSIEHKTHLTKIFYLIELKTFDVYFYLIGGYVLNPACWGTA